MPLDAQGKTVARHLDCFDKAVRRYTCYFQPTAQVTDALVVQAIHFGDGAADDLGQPAVFSDLTSWGR